MKPRILLLTALLTLPVLAAAQDTTLPEIPPMTSEPVVAPTPTTPTPAQPTAPSAPAAAAVGVSGVQASLDAPRTVTGKVGLTLTLKNSNPVAITFGVRRDNEQNCSTAPQVRVLQVGTRAVVYPVSGAAPRLCAQDLETKIAPAKGSVTFARDLDLPPGEYMVEGWLSGFADKTLVKVPAMPVRITVK
ncbi:hypothetical protein [Deinococcus arenicola]|uniref:Intracellular proteinase inhibitor BsuPI domain-containing protein n=1 Tax=Deinococcus arenicola TaxID=2994950 RepID=A0ABU4DLN2_9DEIO|nr:hypothetical protein [Deinococcus sp. ZS9-10]MDV6373343.1 hypothetical protein [Deinococcus sp. ZS9-10]